MNFGRYPWRLVHGELSFDIRFSMPDNDTSYPSALSAPALAAYGHERWRPSAHEIVVGERGLEREISSCSSLRGDSPMSTAGSGDRAEVAGSMRGGSPKCSTSLRLRRRDRLRDQT
jgi:hypothetical protein